MRILIVDDEAPARARLSRMLAQEPGIEAIFEAGDGIEALHLIASERPDALLLDIEMPELSGIDLAASLPEPAPPVVFVTAYDEYALRAFDAAAVDYLLKPFDAARLQRALERLRARLAMPPAPPALPCLPPPSCAPARLPPPRRLLVSERGATRVVAVDDIEWLETADNYVALHLSTPSGNGAAGCAPLLRQTLASLLDQLGPAFLRCHRRAAVRLAAVARIEPLDKGDATLVLRSGARVPCSRQYRAALVAHLAPVRAT